MIADTNEELRRCGAPYTGHWAYEPVVQPEPPQAGESDHPIDRFIAARLQKKGMGFSEPAAPETLLRRLHLDLTGTPPSLEEVDAFLADPEAGYMATIEKLMKSDAFAERLTLDWLDVARYADTNGYSVDDHRDMWAWRDWVIQAFRNNMPYDQFIREQVAGDLLPNATVMQKVATGFLRNSMNTHEGGTIPEEYRVSSIADKIDTVSTAFLGLTVKCAQCHDHKYDPITQEEYFNHSSEPGTGAGGGGNTNPVIQVEPFLQDKNAFKADCQKRIDMLEQHRLFPEIYLGKARRQWEASILAKPETLKGVGSNFPVQSAAQLNGQFAKDPKLKGQSPSWIWINKEGKGHTFTHFRKSFKLATVPKLVQLFVSCDNEAEIWINGHRVQSNKDWREPTVINITPRLRKGNNLIAIKGTDWEFGAGLAALFAYMHSSDGNHIVTDSSWQASVKAPGNWEKKATVGGFTPAAVVQPLGSGPWKDVLDRYQRLRPKSLEPILAELRKPDHLRDPAKQRQIINSFGIDNAEMSLLSVNINKEIEVLKSAMFHGKTSVMIMDEAKPDRKTHILDRGEYNKPLGEVTGGVPAALGALPEGVKPNRLALAEDPQVIIRTNHGDITLRLFQDKAPISVENFLSYVDSGFYSGTIFHRVIPGFMIQGGGFTQRMAQKPTGDPIVNEAKNRLHNTKGTVAMARTNDPDSATSQFFINVRNNLRLDWTPGNDGYTVFGEVIDGMFVVDTIALVPTQPFMGHQNVPVEPVIITEVVRVDSGDEAAADSE